MRFGVRRILIGLKKYTVCVLVAVFISLLISFLLLNNFSTDNPSRYQLDSTTTTTTASSLLLLHRNVQQSAQDKPRNNELVSIDADEAKLREYKMQLYKERVEKLTRNFKKSRAYVVEQTNLTAPKPNFNVHVFYYAWYGNKEYDGAYNHWNHSYLANWKRDDSNIYPTGNHAPPTDIASNYYPSLGCYSSNDPTTIDLHLRQMRDNDIGALVLSWSPPGMRDAPRPATVRMLLDGAVRYGVRVALHVEPYDGRNPINLMEHLRVFMDEYGEHPGLLKITRPLSRIPVPLVYIYDSYLTPAVAWRELLAPTMGGGIKSKLSVRNTKYDAMFVGLLADVQHRYHVKKAHFDGFYTYFATNGFTYGSTWKNWKSLARFASDNGMAFIPSVGPGYIDIQVRPWNTGNTRHRRHGQYYDVAWRTAIGNAVRMISVTSFNEWHEGTQIEPARAAPAMSDSNGSSSSTTAQSYLDYQPQPAYYYLNLTKWWIGQMEKSTRN